MDRRNFFKIVSTVSAGLATNACGNKSNQLIPLLVSDHEIVPGEEQWHPAVCSECSAGCGTMARVMAGERVVERQSQKFRERIACVKKIEGNPADPVSGGRLCARGHAALQSLYNPDRLRGPMLRTAGDQDLKPVSWDEAIGAAVEKLRAARASSPAKIRCLIGPELSARTASIQRFLEALGAPPALTCALDSFAVERKAAEMVFGWKNLPVYDLAPAHYVLGVGADFLGGWISPVYYARQFGQMRQGRADVRGMLVQAESRMSLTAASADEWLPLRPGSEPYFVLSIARLLLDGKLARHADALPPTVRESFETADLGSLIKTCGIEEKKLRRVARQLGESEAPLVVPGASHVNTNSLDALVAAHYLNLMLGNTPKPGGEIAAEPGKILDVLANGRVLLLDGQNPIYTLPAAANAKQSLTAMDSILSFGGFLDDSSAYAHVLLPSHHTLESEVAVERSIGQGAAFAEQFVQPLHATRPLEEILSAIASKFNVTFTPVSAKAFAQEHNTPHETPQAKPANEKLQLRPAQVSGAPDQFPFEFQPYLSLQFHDGRGANLPWMQELPDPSSSAMWDLPVEIDPQSAAKLNIANGDRVRVESPHGNLEAWAYVHPAALPGVVAMAIGQGHTQYGRYASGRGENPLSILAPVWEESTGALATGGTRVRLTRLAAAPGELIQFAPRDREQGPWGRG